MTTIPVPTGTVDVLEVHSQATGQRLRLSVAPGEEGSPVLYVLDPLFIFDVARAAVSLLHGASRLTDGPVPDLTVVGIGYPTEDPAEVFARRARDLTPTRGDATAAIDLPSLEFGGGARFRAAITDEVIPLVESRYAVDRADRILAGFSFSGLFVLDTLFHRPGPFTGYLAGSPSLWWDDGLVFRWEEAWAREHDDLPARLMLWVGGNEQAVGDDWKNERFPREALQRLAQVDRFEAFVTRLRRRGYPGLQLSAVVLDHEYHLTAPAAGITRGLLALFDHAGA